jgi:hypothetical protein
VRFLHLALVAPEPCEAHGGAEFSGLSFLLAGDGGRALEVRFCFSHILFWPPESDFAGYGPSNARAMARRAPNLALASARPVVFGF